MQANGARETEANIDKNMPKTLADPLDQIIKREGFKKHEIHWQNFSTKNGNHLGSLHQINVKGTTQAGDKEVNLFVKEIRTDGKIPDIFSLPNVYKNELFVYKELLKIFNEMQEEAKVPSDERYKTVKFYDESTPEVIIMENMAKKGYKVLNRMETASLPYTQSCIKELAKFHALAFVLNEKRPEFVAKKLKPNKTYINFDGDWRSFLVNTVMKLTMPLIDDKYKERVEKKYRELMENYDKFFNSENTLACVCHGDFRSSNILVKMENDAIKDIVNVDYQTVHYASPIHDFMKFIFYTDRSIRQLHLSDLKNLYYDTLSSFIKKFDLDPESICSKQEFERAFKEKLEYGLAVSLAFMIFSFEPEDGDLDFVDVNFKGDERFRERMRGVIEDYIQWGYL